MAKPITVKDLARMGGKARAAKLTPEQRKAIADKAAAAAAAVHKAKKAARIAEENTHSGKNGNL